MVQTIRERMARVNAEKLAENNRPKHTAYNAYENALQIAAIEFTQDIDVEFSLEFDGNIPNEMHTDIASALYDLAYDIDLSYVEYDALRGHVPDPWYANVD